MMGLYYLIAVDSFSKWPEVMKCKNLTCSGTIRFLHEIFVRFSIPDRIVSDNGTHVTAKEFDHFCKTFLIKHVTTEPYHPRYNGQKERFEDTFKWALKKKSDGNESVDDILQFLRVYRVTPAPSIGSGWLQAELMFVRKRRLMCD